MGCGVSLLLHRVLVEGEDGTRTRNVSPTIHLGAELPVESTKNAPRHVVLVNLDSWKSAGLMLQLREPPKLRLTLTDVSQAAKNGLLVVVSSEFLASEGKKERTICVVVLKIARSGLRTWDLGKDLRDEFRGPAYECRARVDRGVRGLPRG